MSFKKLEALIFYGGSADMMYYLYRGFTYHVMPPVWVVVMALSSTIVTGITMGTTAWIGKPPQ